MFLEVRMAYLSLDIGENLGSLPMLSYISVVKLFENRFQLS